ncbi:type II toxin-antitoxin system death-on-curing family toxin [Pseudoflavonifractor phocaeensis]|uniref:type II toxin-antitoxin system death-on-curing family toxin n=1 Tax=Pseudoflavonifractor phocaeensis TaxID=1870988 RepID=UPI00195E432C|nr:type II toxin-antitoxin system death-on-curing family toxin [Pseudoflavonifractor phocaeensis]MBM6888019.1 type II toxin-antitoxin system death-on-curing family toxin [Pseudoflavonifractor phocaeensis]
MIWPTTEDVLAIHSRIIERSGGMDGLRDRAGLEAAIAAPLQSFGGEDLFPTVPEKVARLGYGLAANHAFLDGNKRIGAMMTQLLLQWNGYQMDLKPGDLADMFIAIADGKAGEAELLKWIQQHIVEEKSGLGR